MYIQTLKQKNQQKSLKAITFTWTWLVNNALNDIFNKKLNKSSVQTESFNIERFNLQFLDAANLPYWNLLSWTEWFGLHVLGFKVDFMAFCTVCTMCRITDAHCAIGLGGQLCTNATLGFNLDAMVYYIFVTITSDPFNHSMKSLKAGLHIV